MATQTLTPSSRRELPIADAMVFHLLGRYEQATPAEQLSGTAWYDDAHALAGTLAKRYRFTLRQTAAAIAVLSPRVDWEHNKRLAERACELYRLGNPPDALDAIGNSARRAWIALSGDLSDVNRTHRTLKVHNFYRSVMLDHGAVCVDRHALRAACGYDTPAITNGGMTDACYVAVASAFTRAARMVAEPSYVFQAITWVVQRRITADSNPFIPTVAL